MGVDHSAVSGAKYAATSIAAMMVQIPLQDVTEIGQVASILVSIVSGVVALIKLFKRKK